MRDTICVFLEVALFCIGCQWMDGTLLGSDWLSGTNWKAIKESGVNEWVAPIAWR